MFYNVALKRLFEYWEVQGEYDLYNNAWLDSDFVVAGNFVSEDYRCNKKIQQLSSEIKAA